QRLSGCQSGPYGFQPASTYIPVRGDVKRPLEPTQEMERTQRSNVGERGNAEASIAEVSVDVRDDALHPAAIEFPIALRRKTSAEARGEDMPIQLPDQLLVFQASRLSERAQARAHASGHRPDDAVGA